MKITADNITEKIQNFLQNVGANIDLNDKHWHIKLLEIAFQNEIEITSIKRIDNNTTEFIADVMPFKFTLSKEGDTPHES